MLLLKRVKEGVPINKHQLRKWMNFYHDKWIKCHNNAIQQKNQTKLPSCPRCGSSNIAYDRNYCFTCKATWYSRFTFTADTSAATNATGAIEIG